MVHMIVLNISPRIFHMFIFQKVGGGIHISQAQSVAETAARGSPGSCPAGWFGLIQRPGGEFRTGSCRVAELATFVGGP